jgi:hypothetical protein
MKTSFVLLIVLILNGCALKYVTPVPVIDTFSPASGKVGIAVTLTGSCFGTQPQVFLNGTVAQITNVISTHYTYSDQITFIVPGAATSGRITVKNSGGTATTVASFMITN